MHLVSSLLPYAQIILSILLVAGILLQQRGAGLGSAFGGAESFGYNARRGSEKIIFNTTIVVAILFVASTVLSLIIK